MASSRCVLFFLLSFFACFTTDTASYAQHAEQELNEHSDFGDKSLDPKDYPTVPGIGFPQSKCNVDWEDQEGSPTRGKIIYSCRTTRLTHQQGKSKIWKFLALACRNGSSPWIAAHKASKETRSMIFSSQLKAKDTLSDRSDFITDREILNCVRGADAVADPPTLTVTPFDSEPKQDPHTVVFKMRSSDRYRLAVRFFAQIEKGHSWPGPTSHYDLGKDATYKLGCVTGEKICYGAWREGQNVSWGAGRDDDRSCNNCCAACGTETDISIGDGGPDAGPPPAVFVLTNEDRYKLGVEFYSMSRTHVWPGDNQQYNLSGTRTYKLTCEAGEKICYGAWRNYQTHYWGAGRGGKEACTRCCTTCGGKLSATLTDGGPDSYPTQTSRMPVGPTYMSPPPASSSSGITRTAGGRGPTYHRSPPVSSSTITGIRGRSTPSRSSPRSRSTITGLRRH